MVQKRTEITVSVDREGFPALVEELKKVFDLVKAPEYVDLQVGENYDPKTKFNERVLTLTIEY